MPTLREKDVIPLSQLIGEPVEWLWPGRIAAGSLTIIDGDPGLGKSLLTLDLAARLSTGRPLPGDALGQQPWGRPSPARASRGRSSPPSINFLPISQAQQSQLIAVEWNEFRSTSKLTHCRIWRKAS